jgi:P-type Cu+ transporter
MKKNDRQSTINHQLRRLSFVVLGMHCASCVYTVEKALKKVEGVENAVVNLATGKATITVDSGWSMVDRAKNAVENIGYKLENEEPMTMKGHDHAKMMKEQELSSLKFKSIVGLVAGGLILWGTFPVLIKTSPLFLQNYFIQFILATIVQFWSGYIFYKAAWPAIKHRQANMDSLVVLGTSVAYLYSVTVTFFPQVFHGATTELMPYFDVSSLVIALVLLGRFFEAKAKLGTSDAIKKLIGLQAKEATVLLKKGDTRLMVNNQ